MELRKSKQRDQAMAISSFYGVEICLTFPPDLIKAPLAQLSKWQWIKDYSTNSMGLFYKDLKCYYIQPGRNIGYQRDVNLPALRPGIRLSQSRSFVCTSQGIWTDSRVQPKTTPPEIRARVAFQRDIRDCNILCLKETWLAGNMLSESKQATGFSVHCANRNKHLSCMKKGGGVCFMIKDSWCNCNNIQEFKSFCSPSSQSNADRITSQENSSRLSSQPCISPRKWIPRRPSMNFTQTGNHIQLMSDVYIDLGRSH
jgi:hypothetical protein